MNSAFDINMAVLSNGQLREKLSRIPFEEAAQDFNCFITKCGDYALAKKNFPYDDIENPAQSVIDTCKNCIKSNPQKNDFIVIYGLGLGYILDEVYNRYPSRIFVYEPDLQVLRFVMENVDLTHILSDKRVYITNDCNDCCKKIGEQYLSHDKLEIVYLKNYGLIKPQELIKLSNMLFNTCKAKISDIKALRSVSKIWVENIIKNIEHVNYLKPFYNLDNAIMEGTALILTAGPSLKDNIEKIKTSRNKFTVFATGKTLKTLELAGIIPDFVVFSDAKNSSDLKTLSQEFVSQINCITDIKSDFSVQEYNWKNHFYYFANNSDFVSKIAEKHGLKLYSAVGTSTLNALMCAAQMGYKKIALCGFDLAFKNDIAYCDDTRVNFENNNAIINNYSINKTLVKSVNGEMVATREDYAAFIPQCENSLKLFEDIDVYNVTDFGAYVKGLTYTTLEAITPSQDACEINSVIEKQTFDKINLKNDLESEVDTLNELKEVFSSGDINYTKIYSLKKSALISEYTRFDVLELVQCEFTREHLEKFVANIVKGIDEVKGMILKNLVKL